MYGGPIGTHQRSFEWYYPRPPMASPSSRLGVCNLATPLISGTGKATDFKFGGYIYRANPNKSPLKILEKMERGRIQGLPAFLRYPLLSQERIKLRTSNLAGTFTRPIRIKGHLKFCRKGSVDESFCRNIHLADQNVGNSSRGRSQGVPKFFRAPTYRAHCAVIFAIAQLSCKF